MTIDDRNLVKLCLKEVYLKLGYDQNHKLSQSDFEHLSYLVEEKSKIIISLSTLKRIFKEEFERLPQSSTLDALTVFLGYTGWQDFKAKKLLDTTSGSILKVTKPNGGLWNLMRVLRYPLIIFGIAAIVFVMLWNSISSPGVSSIAFSVRKVVSDHVPKNVIFNYNIDNIEGDSFFIQPSWNDKARIRIYKKNHTQTETYYEPGYHTAKLIGDGKVLKEAIVHIPTKDWIGYSKASFFDPYPEYFKNEFIEREHVLTISEEGLLASHIDVDKEKVYYFAHFPDSLAVNSDNFTLKARVRMKPLGPNLCPWIVSEVISENSFFYFTGTTPGCTSEIQAVFSDKHINGKTNDLSGFGFDVFNWNEIEIEVRKKMVTVHVNGEEVFHSAFTRPGGTVQGMGFGSNGLCEVDWVELADSAGNVCYFNDFNALVSQR